jgi:hypothetical protein
MQRDLSSSGTNFCDGHDKPTRAFPQKLSCLFTASQTLRQKAANSLDSLLLRQHTWRRYNFRLPSRCSLAFALPVYDAARAGTQLPTFREGPLNLGTICCSETLATNYQPTPRHIPEQRRPRYRYTVNSRYDFHTGIIFFFDSTGCSSNHLPQT